jgi:predicted acyltransferase
METKPIRFGALDVFRGLTIIFMIIVNSPGNWSFVYGPLLHAEWHGFTPTDLVFPSFLFAVGTAMSFTMKKWSELSGSEAGLKILKRTSLLFLFGYLMYWYPFFRLDLAWNFSAFPISETRIFGVLQRIALAYGIAAALLHFAGKKWTYTLVLISLPVYWILLEKFGMVGLDPLSLEGNAVRALDLKLIGANHMYMGEGIAFDPEGLLSTLPSVANVVAGYATGLFIQRDRNRKNTRIDLLLLGTSLFFVAFVWDLAFPINKKLWTSSYALLTIGLDLAILGVLMGLLPHDKKLPAWGQFFETAGKNPLAIYLLSELALITLYTLPAGTSSAWEWIYSNGFAWMGAKLGSFIMAAAFALFCWGVGYWMDKKRLYWRV